MFQIEEKRRGHDIHRQQQDVSQGLADHGIERRDELALHDPKTDISQQQLHGRKKKEVWDVNAEKRNSDGPRAGGRDAAHEQRDRKQWNRSDQSPNRKENAGCLADRGFNSSDQAGGAA